jgi:hypothetical protein
MVKFLSKHHTPLAVKQYIIHGLFTWLENGCYHTELPPPATYLRIKRTMAIQENIGWNHFVCGRIAIEWGHIINNQIDQIKSGKITA